MPGLRQIFTQAVEDIHSNADKLLTLLISMAQNEKNPCHIKTTLETLAAGINVDHDDVRGALAALILTDKVEDVMPMGGNMVGICLSRSVF